MNASTQQLAAAHSLTSSSVPPQTVLGQQYNAAAAANAVAGFPTRRVTLGGMHQGMDRRSSLGSTLSLDPTDIFGRRSSLGFDMSNMDMNFLTRRDSLDSTTAVLDAAILDLTRRRLSMAMGTAAPGPDHLSVSAAAAAPTSWAAAAASNPAAAAAATQTAATASLNSAASSVGSLMNRQQQLQQQQLELEKRQKELELQRQHLIAGMQETKAAMLQASTNLNAMSVPSLSGASALSGVNALSGTNALSASAFSGTNSLTGFSGANALTGGAFSGTNALTGTNSFTGSALTGTNSFTGSALTGTNALTGSALAGSSSLKGGLNPQTLPGQPRQQWWVCQVCNSKAFASHEEALQHEAICGLAAHDATSGISLPSLSTRSFSLGLGGADIGAPSAAAAVAANALSPTPANAPSSAVASARPGLPSSSGPAASVESTMSNGPFAVMQNPMPLAMDSDRDWLTPLHCFVRRHCVQVFTASSGDVSTPSKGKRKPIQVGQVGIRCPHCHTDDNAGKARERGSVYYPTSIASIYNATMNLLQRHLHHCSAVPPDIRSRYETLKGDDARSGTSKRYWVESALCLGLVDTPHGIRYSALRPPALPSLGRQAQQGNSSNGDLFSSKSNAVADLSDNPGGAEGVTSMSSNDAMPKTEESLTHSAPLVTPEDEACSTGFSFHLLSQMQPCVFTEADRLGKRKGLPLGFPGLACRHCFGGYGSGRFFPSSIKTLSDTSKTLNVLHNHMQRCRKCPEEVRNTLDMLRTTHDEERSKMKFGSQKAFFARIWERLHKSSPSRGPGASKSTSSAAELKRKVEAAAMADVGSDELTKRRRTS